MKLKDKNFETFGADTYQCELNAVLKQYIIWYNYEHLHSALGYMTPHEKEIQLKQINKIAA